MEICLKECFSASTIIVGSGAAGFNAADSLYQLGQTDIAIITEDINKGTSRNAGSDKQTYYKLSLSGNEGDSVREMAETIFKGRATDGDTALCEAALSPRCFFKLVNMGVPFPQNRYGEYVGYKTDHDPRSRATSAGPYTSKIMTECLEKSVKDKGIPIFDHLLVVRILTENNHVCGLLCLDLQALTQGTVQYIAFRADNILLATGGPGGIYKDSVYPKGQVGATGIAFEAGAKGRNLTEWQYGIASINPRWNVSGSYMQVLPRFVSTKEDGSDESEFLDSFLKDFGNLLSLVFLKGYQWPFDVRKIQNGSSLIDVLVFLEIQKGRRVFLDYSKNPHGLATLDYSILSKEAEEYLRRAGICFGTPIQRLTKLNSPAVLLYQNLGVDLRKEYLEIAFCAQHNNGGLAVDSWWQTNIEGLFAVGEVSGTHGVYRPGGCALNAGQVGSLRAAEFITAKCKKTTNKPKSFSQKIIVEINEMVENTKKISCSNQSNINELYEYVTTRMSSFGSAFRESVMMEKFVVYLKESLAHFFEKVTIRQVSEMKMVMQVYNIILCQYVYLSAFLDYARKNGKSRGSALYYSPNGIKPYQDLPDMFSFLLEKETDTNLIQEIKLSEGKCLASWRSPKPLPQDDNFFEKVWAEFRDTQCVY